MSVTIIIGKNFGDEGKGLAADYFAARSRSDGRSCLVIRHNGGGQAGHTVDFPEKRFIFHQLSSGSFRGADTCWADSFLPDLYKLPEELEDFAALDGKVPRIYGHPRCRCVYIDDVLVNMALETARGTNRHGSCGMGINEAVLRSGNPDFCLSLGDILGQSADALYRTLLRLRREYLPRRLEALGLKINALGEYGELLTDANVLRNAACQMAEATRWIIPAEGRITERYADILFEGAQGLLLDENYTAFAPHLTSSQTGLDNPAAFLREHMPQEIPEVVYVTRSYVTRHGAGPLPNEGQWKQKNIEFEDLTNVHNTWQGGLRFAPHGTREDFFGPVRADLEKQHIRCLVSCMVTHLNESQGTILSTQGNIPVEKWFQEKSARETVQGLYCAFTPYSGDMDEKATET